MSWLRRARSRVRHAATPQSLGSEAESSASRVSQGTSYSPDRPISIHKEDRFQRWGFARRIADTIVQREEPRSVVVGIFGAWGEGKTSLLNLLEEALRGDERVITVRFNPWYFTSEAVLLTALFSTLARAIGEKLPTMAERMGQALKKWGQVAALASGSVAGGVISVSPGAPLAKLGEALSEASPEDLRDRIQCLLREAQRRVVVLIDDIDRLDCSEIQALFKIIRLSAEFDFVNYVLAFDERIVSASLAERYPTGQEKAGTEFLEKIIQVPLHLPPADHLALRTLTFEGIDEALKVAGIVLTNEEVQTFVVLFTRGLEPALATPRQARRYANALLFALPLLKGEVHVLDQLLLEGFHVFYPTLYNLLRSHPAELLGEMGLVDEQLRQRQRELIANGTNGLTALSAKAVEQVLGNLFPRLKSVGYGAEWEAIWAKSKRACSEQYFARYFSYSVPASDISDIAFEKFVESLQEDSSVAAQLWETLANLDNAARIIERLRRRVTDLNAPAAQALSLAIASSGSRLPRESGVFTFLSTFDQAAILISELVSRLPDEGRRAHAEKVLEVGEPLTFAAECLGWLVTPEDSERDRTLTKEEEGMLGKVLAARIRVNADACWLASTFSSGIASLLRVWKDFGEDGARQVRDYLERSFAEQPRRVPEFLAAFTGQARGLESGIPLRAMFAQQSYNMVSEYVAPVVVRRHLEELFGDQLDPMMQFAPADMANDRAIANQFAFVDNHVRLYSGASPSPTD